MDRQAARAALFLLLATGPLAEVLSANVSLFTFMQPLPFVLVTLTYGVPVLLIRELAVARRLNPLGVALLGLACGILNEGVIAKTLTQPGGPPLFDFAGYGQVGMLQAGWTIFMVVWHAPHSVLYPLLLCRWMFPAAAGRRWFASGRSRSLLYLLLVALAGLYALYFLNPLRSDPGVFGLYVVATLGLVGIALRYCIAARSSPATPPPNRTPQPALIGSSMVIFYLFQLWSPAHLPFLVFLAISTGSIVFVTVSMRRAGWRPVPELLLFGLGDDLTFSLLAAALGIVAGRNALELTLAGALFLALFVYLIRAVGRQPFGRGGLPAPLPTGAW